jgi:catechol 2,3-dioxygenase-like lactoylglutathione lyase family enzyme
MKAEFKSASGYQGNNMNLPVENLEAAIPFYDKVMGFRLLSRSDSPHRSAVQGEWFGKEDIRVRYRTTQRYTLDGLLRSRAGRSLLLVWRTANW